MNPLFDYIQRNRVIVKIDKAQKSKSRNLTLEDFDLTTFPEPLLNCNDVHSLGLQRNRISELPKEMGVKLQQLTHLSIQYNNFQSFPECIKYLSNLITLNLSHNPIKSIPKEIGGLTNLEVIWCNFCCLTSLPEELGDLPKIETFGARNNKISKLPDKICKWKNLRWLSLESNDLTTVPKDFGNLKSLVHLNLNNNQFSVIPEAITKIDCLKFLHLRKNFFVYVEERILLAMTHCKINLLDNPLIEEPDFQVYTNVFTALEEIPAGPPQVESDDSSGDWENSLDSYELNYSTTDSSDSEDDQFVETIPKLSKFFVTY